MIEMNDKCLGAYEKEEYEGTRLRLDEPVGIVLETDDAAWTFFTNQGARVKSCPYYVDGNGNCTAYVVKLLNRQIVNLELKKCKYVEGTPPTNVKFLEVG